MCSKLFVTEIMFSVSSKFAALVMFIQTSNQIIYIILRFKNRYMMVSLSKYLG